MKPSFITAQGETILLDELLGQGGEGCVYSVTGHPTLAAKIYHQIPSSRKQAKLSYMVACANDALLSYTSWPRTTLHRMRNGPVVGFLMNNVSMRQPVHILYSPVEQHQHYPHLSWDFLLFCARNTAAAFAAIHANGHIIGDVNQGNVMVGQDSRVIFIDCDSYQINAPHDHYLCEVGVSHFTPPELQGISTFQHTPRTQNHDNFGLALLIFHLLFGGRHPYSGIPLRTQKEITLEDNIKALRFAYARDAQKRHIAPPPGTIPVSLLPPLLLTLFERAFTEPGMRQQRPDANEWVTALDQLRSTITQCEQASRHRYPNHLTACPWCQLEDQGLIYFSPQALLIHERKKVTNKIKAAIHAAGRLPKVIIPHPDDYMVNALPYPPIDRHAYFAPLLSLLVFIGSGGAVFYSLNMLFPALMLNISVWIACALRHIFRRRKEIRRRYQNLQQAQDRYQHTEREVRHKIACQNHAGLIRQKTQLHSQLHQYLLLDKEEKRQIHRRGLEKRQQYKKHALQRFLLDSSPIAGINNHKKQELYNQGIITAADIEISVLNSLNGIGKTTQQALLDWKRNCELKSMAGQRLQLPESEKNAIRARINTQRKALEERLHQDEQQLRQTLKQTARIYSELQPLLLRLDRAAGDLAQAQADVQQLNRIN